MAWRSLHAEDGDPQPDYFQGPKLAELHFASTDSNQEEPLRYS